MKFLFVHLFTVSWTKSNKSCEVLTVLFILLETQKLLFPLRRFVTVNFLGEISLFNFKFPSLNFARCVDPRCILHILLYFSFMWFLVGCCQWCHSNFRFTGTMDQQRTVFEKFHPSSYRNDAAIYRCARTGAYRLNDNAEYTPIDYHRFLYNNKVFISKNQTKKPF